MESSQDSLSIVFLSSIAQESGKKALWGEAIGTVGNVSNVSLEDVFSRILRLNGERKNRLSNVSDVSRGRGLSIRHLRCVHFYRLAHARWLCCKKSQRNTMDELLPFLLRLGCHPKQARDERYLACDVSFVYPLHLPFPHDVHHLIALERPPR
jgi:hypothetical protein